MEVEEANWVHQASENIDKYLHRGGDNKGNEPQLLGGSDLLNTIGIAMGLPLPNPVVWSYDQIEAAHKGELVFFEHDSLDAINVIANAIRSCCNGDENVYLTVIPIELYYQNKLYEIPIFKVQRYHHSKTHYVDNIGRIYDNFDDWNSNNKLPPCKMIYPQKLELISDGQHSVVSAPYDTPSAKTENKVLQGVDIAAGVVGVGAAIGLMVISGPAAPFIAIIGVASVLWGTGRAANDLIDREEHGQSINPFTDSTARMLWLGIAASVAGFAAMGATMRLSAVAARGIQISNALKILTNVINGASFTLNTAAIINNSIYIIQHLKEMTPGEILLNVALLAFWTKGNFSYKRSSVIIREIREQAFTHISQELPPESRNDFAELRSRIQTMLDIDETQLLQAFSQASKSNISIRECAEFLIDGMRYYDVATNLSSEQVEAFNSLRSFIRDDLQLLTGLQRVAAATNLNREETFSLVLSIWENYLKIDRTKRDDLHFVQGNFVIGHAPPIEISELPKLSPSLIKFVGEHLSNIDSESIHEYSIKELIALQDRGLFTECPVSGISNGHSTIILNNQLHISLRKLQSFPEDTCSNIFRMVGRLDASTSKLPSDVVKLCVSTNRLRFEIQRNESVTWARNAMKDYGNLSELVSGELMPHEKDRLFTFKTELSTKKAEDPKMTFMNEMLSFVSQMEPKNITEMVAYSEFVISCIVDASAVAEKSIQDGAVKLPHNTNKKVWLRQQAKQEVFKDMVTLKQKFYDYMKIVEDNDMVGTQEVAKGLSDQDLVAAIRSHKIRFGGKVSAAYHIYKHSTDPPSAYIEQANSTMKSASSQYTVSLGQEGTTRIVAFKDDNGSCIVIEINGRVFLATFRANDRK